MTTQTDVQAYIAELKAQRDQALDRAALAMAAKAQADRRATDMESRVQELEGRLAETAAKPAPNGKGKSAAAAH